MSSPCSQEADRIKDIHSPVAGEADILLAPDLETDDMLAKQLSYPTPGKNRTPDRLPLPPAMVSD